jgi:hypothetical protein
MKILMSSGLVSGERTGNRMHYSLVREKYDEMIIFIQYLTGDKSKDGMVWCHYPGQDRARLWHPSQACSQRYR